MPMNNPANERIKRQYFTFLKEAQKQSEATVDAVAEALARFEASTAGRDFKAFHHQQAVAFKKRLSEQRNARTGKELSKATLHGILGNLKRFFQWLAGQPGYKSKIKYPDAEYFNLSDKEARIATAQRDAPYPTLEQIHRVLEVMPGDTGIEKRNRALVAFALLTAARDGAIASMKLKHVNLEEGHVYQDAREVRTKYSKTFPTYFFQVGGEARTILIEWVAYLRAELLCGDDDPLFPATETAIGPGSQFRAVGLTRAHWSSAAPIRSIFRDAFALADLPYFHPHTLRKTLVALGHKVCKTPEDLKAWSQNLGHESVLTTLRSYGAVGRKRQGEIIEGLGVNSRPSLRAEELARLFDRFLSEQNAGSNS